AVTFFYILCPLPESYVTRITHPVPRGADVSGADGGCGATAGRRNADVRRPRPPAPNRRQSPPALHPPERPLEPRRAGSLLRRLDRERRPARPPRHREGRR